MNTVDVPKLDIQNPDLPKILMLRSPDFRHKKLDYTFLYLIKNYMQNDLG